MSHRWRCNLHLDKWVSGSTLAADKNGTNEQKHEELIGDKTFYFWVATVLRAAI
jgi:hypothetical protein